MAMTTLVCYDVSDDITRARLAAYLQHRGNRIQRSVFLCHLDPDKLTELRTHVDTLINPRHRRGPHRPPMPDLLDPQHRPRTSRPRTRSALLGRPVTASNYTDWRMTPRRSRTCLARKAPTCTNAGIDRSERSSTRRCATCRADPGQNPWSGRPRIRRVANHLTPKGVQKPNSRHRSLASRLRCEPPHAEGRTGTSRAASCTAVSICGTATGPSETSTHAMIISPRHPVRVSKGARRASARVKLNRRT
uniref:CRISPR-associated endonuclease Cas2 n=1 Tax=Saccharothrix mutabilis TaxID=33921 RepID=UPI003CD06BCA